MYDPYTARLLLNQDDIFRSAKHGNPTPYQYGMKLSMDGPPTPTTSKNTQPTDEYPGLKGIHDTPKYKTKPVFTNHGKIIFVTLILGLAVYVIYKSHKASQAAENQPGNPNPSPTTPGEISEPPAPVTNEQPMDPSPRATELPK